MGGLGDLGMGRFGEWKMGNGVSGVRSDYDPTSAVILSGTKWSRKILLLEAQAVQFAKSSFYVFNQQIYSLVSCFWHSLMLRSSPLRYAPVEKTAVYGRIPEATSLKEYSERWKEQVKSNKAFEALSSENLIRNKIKQIYSAEIGVREKTGKNDGERVEEYLAVTQLGKGYAWCAAFVSWVFSEAGFPQPRTPWSPALFPKDRLIWERGKVLKPNTLYRSPRWPATADVFGIYFANLKRVAHVGFVDEWGDKYAITVEGNTNEAGNNEGDGVYRKRRLIGSIYQVSDWVHGQKGAIK
jgi:hypothetical protein